jgi:tetratricopeptide (TPR) repeat protein
MISLPRTRRLVFSVLAPAEASPKAKAAALKALEIDDSIASAHTVLGWVHLYYDWDWSGAEHALKRAIELNPNYAWGHLNWSDCLLVLGRDEEAITEAQLLVELDPLWAGAYVKLGQMLCYKRYYDRALEQLQRSLELDSNFVWAHVFLALVYAWKGRDEESLAACEKVANLFGGNPHSTARPSCSGGWQNRRGEGNPNGVEEATETRFCGAHRYSGCLQPFGGEGRGV